MKVEGRLIKAGGWWAAEVPSIGIHTQGRTKADAYDMVKDAIESLDGEDRVRVDVAGQGESFYVSNSGPDFGAWMAFLLRRVRQEGGKSLEDIRRDTGAPSRNAYARYEAGNTIPSLEKFDELLSALSSGVSLVIK